MTKSFSLLSAAALGLATVISTSAMASDTPYTVEGDKVDEKTWLGMKIYQRGGCEACHGADANGGAAFPSLTAALKDKIDEAQLTEIVKNGRNTMPPKMESVMSIKMLEKNGIDTEEKAMDALYAYLKGRADGAFGPSVKKMKK